MRSEYEVKLLSVTDLHTFFLVTDINTNEEHTVTINHSDYENDFNESETKYKPECVVTETNLKYENMYHIFTSKGSLVFYTDDIIDLAKNLF